MKFLQSGIRFIGESTDLKHTISELVRLAAAAAGSEMGSLYLVDKEAGVLKPFVLVGLPEVYTRGCGEIKIGSQCCGRAVLHKRPWVVSDMLTDPLFAEARQAALDSGIRAGFSVPVLSADGEALGSLASHFREPYTPSPYAIERNRLFATLISFAIARHQQAGISSQHAAD